MNHPEVATLYKSVIEDVIKQVRGHFWNMGVDEQVLFELQELWETKLIESKVLTSMEPPPPPQQTPHITAGQLMPPPGQKGVPMPMMMPPGPSGVPHYYPGQPGGARYPSGQPYSLPGSMSSLPQSQSMQPQMPPTSILYPSDYGKPRPYVMPAGQQASQSQPSAPQPPPSSLSTTQAPPLAATQHHLPRSEISESEANAAIQKKLESVKKEPPATSQQRADQMNESDEQDGESGGKKIKLADGSSAGASTTSSLSSMPPMTSLQASASVLMTRPPPPPASIQPVAEVKRPVPEDEDLLGSDLDDDSEEEEDGAGHRHGSGRSADTHGPSHGGAGTGTGSASSLVSQGSSDTPQINLMLCQYEKVTRIKTKWRAALKDGIMHLNGTDYAFNRANGEFEWN